MLTILSLRDTSPKHCEYEEELLPRCLKRKGSSANQLPISGGELVVSS